jgi:hypothetical protein
VSVFSWRVVESPGGINEVALIYRTPWSKTGPVISYSPRTPLRKRLTEAVHLEPFRSP